MAKSKQNDKVVALLKKVGAMITDSHIVLVSGRHTDTYINPDALLPHPKEVSQIAKLFAEKFKDLDIDIVAAPAVGGIVLSTWTAYHLSKLKKKEILGIFTEKLPDRSQVLERGFDTLVKGKKILVIEDITTTGGSVKKVVDSLRGAGGKVVAVSVMVNRDPKLVTKEAVGGPFSPLAVFNIVSYEEKECPLCKNNTPVNPELGHGKEYLEEKAKKK
jgi:orotate phosphoribosyltransferase